MTKKYIDNLTTEEQAVLDGHLRGGKMGICNVKRVQILLKDDEGWIDERFTEALDVGLSTVERTRSIAGEKNLR